ncbi:hypothetical protein [Shewanella sp. SM23]|uniref:hypothetical protein n=1 Tax=Shewanella sp. SM23 TaxID=2912794 RepID=UPI0021DB7403|nr:hypothetical protein [Shewanella sp. SM23]MCU8085307.1 hypothetical protein [Shewanella sp. SM23]
MTTLLDKMGQLVAVHIHTSNDTSFKKKPVRLVQLQFPILEPVAQLLSHVSCYSNDFKICLEDVNDDVAAQHEFTQNIIQLNKVMWHLGEDSFLHYVAAESSLFIDNIESNIRSADGTLRGIHEIKQIFSEAVVKHLRTNGIESKCNIGYGSIYVDDKIVINSGITQSTVLSNGIMNFTEFKIDPSAQYNYSEQYHKAPQGFYEPGSWTNIRGDELLVITYKMAAYSALSSFLSRTAFLLNKDIASDSFLSAAISNAQAQYSRLAEAYSELVSPKAFDTAVLLNNESVRKSETYQELELLGLGGNSIKEFVENEAAYFILEDLSKSIGADRVSVFNPKHADEKNDKCGYFDEFYTGHVSLPSKKTRQGMLALKQALDQPTSLASFLIDKNHLKLNVIASYSGYDQHLDEPIKPYQCVQVCLGGRPPLVKSGDIISFYFYL